MNLQERETSGSWAWMTQYIDKKPAAKGKEPGVKGKEDEPESRLRALRWLWGKK